MIAIDGAVLGSGLHAHPGRVRRRRGRRAGRRAGLATDARRLPGRRSRRPGPTPRRRSSPCASPASGRRSCPSTATASRSRRCTCGSTGAAQALADALVPDPAGEPARRWAEIHGFTPGTSLGHVLWFHAQPEIHDRTAAYLEPMDYLNARFTGVIAATANSAMPIGLTDNRRLGCARMVGRADRAGRRRPLATARADAVVERARRRFVPDVADSLGIRTRRRRRDRRQRQHRRRVRRRRARARARRRS